MLGGEGFADDDGIGVAEFGEDFFGGTAGEKMRIVVGAQGVEVSRGEGGRHIFVSDLIGAETVDGLDAGKFGDGIGEFNGDGGVAISGGISRGANVEVGGEFIVHPEDDGLTEAADHDADGSHHSDGGGESGDENGGAAERCGEAARGEKSLDAEEFAERSRS